MSDLVEPLTLVEYDPAWTARFAEETRRLSAIHLQHSAIEHIGSTSVPGLPAKPIVDIMIGVPSLEAIRTIRSALRSAGYEDPGDAGVPRRVYFRHRGEQSFNLRR